MCNWLTAGLYIAILWGVGLNAVPVSADVSNHGHHYEHNDEHNNDVFVDGYIWCCSYCHVLHTNTHTHTHTTHTFTRFKLSHNLTIYNTIYMSFFCPGLCCVALSMLVYRARYFCTDNAARLAFLPGCLHTLPSFRVLWLVMVNVFAKSFKERFA